MPLHDNQTALNYYILKFTAERKYLPPYFLKGILNDKISSFEFCFCFPPPLFLVANDHVIFSCVHFNPKGSGWGLHSPFSWEMKLKTFALPGFQVSDTYRVRSHPFTLRKLQNPYTISTHRSFSPSCTKINSPPLSLDEKRSYLV